MTKSALDLPAEIQQLVLTQLELPTPLFRPVYGKIFKSNALEDGSLERKHRLYWGKPRTAEQNEGVLTLLNLAKTSQFYANWLSPMIYETVVLRPTAASLAFVKELQQSPKWNLVKNLIVCTVYRSVEDPASESKAEDDLRELFKDKQQSDIEEGLVLAHGHGFESSTKLQNATEALKAALSSAAKDESSKTSDDGKTKSQKDDRGSTQLPDDFEYDYDPSGHIDFDMLSEVLRNLPPNLQSLTIDMPTNWIEIYETGDYLDIFVHETADEILKNEEENVYRKQIRTIYDAVCCQDNIDMLKTRSDNNEDFELRLLNVPPFSSSAFPGATEYPHARQPEDNPDAEEPDEEKQKPQASKSGSKDIGSRLIQLLGTVTSFEISFCWWENGAGWHMNTNSHVASFTASLPAFLFNHLSEKCRSFTFDGDKSWILGDYTEAFASMNPLPLDTDGHEVASDYGSRDIPMPGFKAEACSKLEKLEVNNAFVGKEILNFVSARSSTITSIKLFNCWTHSAPPDSEEEASKRWTWAYFLKALSEKVVGKSLTSIEIAYDRRSTAEIRADKDRYTKGIEFDETRPSFKVSTETNQKGGKRTRARTAKPDVQTFAFGYGVIADKYGDLMVYEDDAAEHVEKGDDWEAWLKLVDVVQKNKEGRS